MSDLIDRNELINQIKDDAENFIGHPTAVALHNAMVEYALDLIREAPAVEVETVKYGWWKDYKDQHTCSVCDEMVFKDPYSWNKLKMRYDYCPHCGAKMDKKEQSNEQND